MEDEVIYEAKSLTNSTFGKMFFWMFMGLLSTAFIAWYSYSSGYVANISFGLLAILEIAVVLIFSLAFRKLSAGVVTFLYFAYAILNGFTFSTIFYLYELQSIVVLFFITAGAFGALAYVGAKTNKDVTNLGTICFTILIAGIILSLINLFMQNSMLDLILDWVVLITFGGITIYDINKIKKLDEFNVMEKDKLYIYGAMEIYLDFINIFIRLLSLFGKRKN